MRFDDKLDLEAFVPQLEKQETAPSPDPQGKPGASGGAGQASAPGREGDDPSLASGNASLAGAPGTEPVLQGGQGMYDAGMDMPEFPAAPEGEDRPALSPKALRHLPQEILDMLGSAALPAGLASEGDGPVSPEEGDTEMPADAQMPGP